MHQLDSISEHIRERLEARNNARERALERSRRLIRDCANAIRAVHRQEWQAADERLETARRAALELIEGVADYPDLYHAGYTQDALKDYVEAFATYAMVRDTPLPGPDDLHVEDATYLKGLAEAASELRRHVLDIIRHDHSQEAERLLDWMDTVYGTLMTFDFPDAITGGLRRSVDALRGVLERTRGDLTNSLGQQRLRQALSDFEQRLGLEGQLPDDQADD
jgi:translin